MFQLEMVGSRTYYVCLLARQEYNGIDSSYSSLFRRIEIDQETRLVVHQLKQQEMDLKEEHNT
jgi:hypothetical protein